MWLPTCSSRQLILHASFSEGCLVIRAQKKGEKKTRTRLYICWRLWSRRQRFEMMMSRVQNENAVLHVLTTYSTATSLLADQVSRPFQRQQQQWDWLVLVDSSRAFTLNSAITWALGTIFSKQAVKPGTNVWADGSHVVYLFIYLLAQ